MKTGKYAAAALRALPEPRCPGIIQGAKLPPLLIDMDQREVQLRYNDGCFKNRIYDLVIEGLDQPVKAFAQTLTYDPLTLEVRNVSFMRYDEGREYEVPIPVKVANTQDNVAMKKGALLIPLQREVRCFFKAIKGENMPPYFVFDARHSPVNTIIRSSHLTYPPTTKPIPKHRDVPLFSITGRGRGGGDDPEDAPAAPAAAAKAAPAAEKKDDKKK